MARRWRAHWPQQDKPSGARPSGTTIEIAKCHQVDHQSARKTVERLQERLGVVYYEFLKGASPRLRITIKCTGKPDVSIQPLDIMFSADAAKGFDKDNYDGKTPCLVLREKVTLAADRTAPPMHLDVVIFPKDQMAKFAGFSEKDRDRLKGYRVNRANKGFFIYRNNRLIRWGDDLDGIVNRDKIGVRAKLVITTAHDDLLHVDVSKQRMTVPEDVLEQLETLLRLPLRQADEAFDACTALLDTKVPEGSSFNATNKDLVEEDPEEPEEEEKRRVIRKRKQELVDDTKERLKEDAELPSPGLGGIVSAIPVFEKVRYSERVRSSVLWESGQDPTDGTFVRINKNHHFYHTVLSKLQPGDRARQAIEAFLWACAAAENKAFLNLVDVKEEAIRSVLSKFKTVLSHSIDAWASKNEDLFDDG